MLDKKIMDLHKLQLAISNTQKENYSGQQVFLFWEMLIDVFRAIVNNSFK